jgi:hypothetical protein
LVDKKMLLLHLKYFAGFAPDAQRCPVARLLSIVDSIAYKCSTIEQFDEVLLLVCVPDRRDLLKLFTRRNFKLVSDRDFARHVPPGLKLLQYQIDTFEPTVFHEERKTTDDVS